MRVGLFVTCLGDTLFPSTGQAVVRLLERLGHEVEFPEEQTCCGQMHLNSGYADEGLALARRLADVFRGYPAVVTPSASCAGMVREQLGEEAPPVYELSEFLVDVLGVEDVGAYYPHRVTYHPTCHSLRALRVGEKPQRLLRSVRGIDLVELPDALECCGFGGTFAVKNADVSTAMLSDKVRGVLDTQRRGGLLGGLVVPDAHRRRAVARPLGRSAGAPGGDPRLDRGGAVALSGFPAAARRSLADSQLRANLARATSTIRDKRARRGGRAPGLGGAAGRRVGDQGRRAAHAGGAARAARICRFRRRGAGALGEGRR